MHIHPTVLSIGLPVFMVTGMLVALELGFRNGRKRRAHHPGESDESTGTVVAAVLGLLALILAFTFSAASDRLTVRRAQIVEEANDIGTAYLRLDLLAPEDQPPIRALFREYVEARIETFEKILDRPASAEALARGARLQREIWSRSAAAARTSPNPSASILLLGAINPMIDITTTRTIASETHAPALILGLLILLSFLAGLLAGDTLAARARRPWLHIFLFALAVSATIYVVFDLEYPRAGFITLHGTDRAMVELRDLMR